MDNKDAIKNKEENTEVKTVSTPVTTKLDTVKLRLVKPHTHEGIAYEKGDFVEVDEASAKYIINTAEAGVKV